jgi:nanoRNase/pAp phosphatase (c-di-AMP/oligoRNAs hydrolase)
MTTSASPPGPRPPFDLEAALRRLNGRTSMLIYTHDNPDPDALAAGLGLRHLVEKEIGAVVTLAHGGIVGRAQNRAMVENLKIPLTPVERVVPD